MALESFASGESGPSLRRFATSYGAAFLLVGGLLGGLALMPKTAEKAEAVVDIRLVLPPPPEPEPPPPPPKPLEVPKPKPAARREIAKIEKAPEPPPPEPPKPAPPAPAPLGLGQPKGPAKPGQATVSSGSTGGVVGGTGTGTGRVVPPPTTASAAPPPPKVVALSEDTEPPVAAGANAMPAYPAALKAEGVEGFVVVRFIVTEAGVVDDLRVVKSSDPRFNDAVLVALKTWRFKPATSQGRPVPYPKTVKIPFKIRTLGTPFFNHPDATTEVLARGAAMGFNLVEIWHTMGSLSKLVAVSLVAMAVLVLGVVIERSFAMARGAAQSREFAKQAAPAIDRGDWQAVVDLAKGYAHSPLARLLGGGARRYLSFSELEEGSGLGAVEATRRELARGAETVGAELRTGMGMLASIGSITPFVGLFGTVVGIITAFQGIAKSGSSGLGAVSAGIAEALVMTAFGLLVAIPAVLLFNYLNGKIDGVERKLTTATGEFIDNLEHYHGSDSGVHERRAA